MLFISISSCTKKIFLQNILNKEVIYIESEFNNNISILFNKKDIIELFYKLMDKNFNEVSKKEDLIFLEHLNSSKQDTMRIYQYQSITFNNCVYNLLLCGKAKVFDKANNRFVNLIYSKKSKSKLGQLNHDFYHLKSSRFFYSYIIAYGE